MRRSLVKRDPLDALASFLDAWVRAEVTYANANRTMAAISCADFTREEFAVYNPKLFGRPRGASSKDSGH